MSVFVVQFNGFMSLTSDSDVTYIYQLSKFQISLAIISVTVQLWIEVFWVISVQFNISNTLQKSRTFLLGHLYIDGFTVNTTTHDICNSQNKNETNITTTFTTEHDKF